MKLLTFELKKLFSRRVAAVSLLVFFAVNLYVLLRNDRLYYTSTDRAYFAAQETLREQYEGPITEEMGRRITTRIRELEEGTGSQDYITGSAGAELESYRFLLADLNALYQYQQRHTQLDRTIDARLTQLAGTEHTYELRRLELMKRTYSPRWVGYYYDTSGFEEWLNHDVSSFLALLLVLVGVAPLFAGEREWGMEPLLKTASHGRTRTVRVKLAAACLYTAVCSSLLFAADLAVSQAIHPFNMSHALLYSVKAYWNTPLTMSIGAFVLLNWLAKTAGLCVVALITALFSALCRRSYAAFFLSLGGAFGMMAAGDRLLLVNPLTLVTFSGRVKDFQTVPLIGWPVLTVAVLPVTMALLAAALITAIHLRERRVRRTRLLRMRPWLRRRLPIGRDVRSGGGEWRKMFCKHGMAAVLLLAVAVEAALCFSEKPLEYFTSPTQQRQYAELFERFGGPPGEELAAFSQQIERDNTARMNAIQALQQRFQSGEITEEAYQEQVSDLALNFSQLQWQQVWQKFRQQVNYALGDPQRRWVGDSRGWSILLGESAPDLPALLAILVLAGTLYALEWESGMADTLRTARRGRRGFARRKTVLLVATVCGLWLLCEGIRLLSFARIYDLWSMWRYPVQSLEYYARSPLSMTVGQTYLCALGLRGWGLLFTAFLAAAFSVQSKKSLTAVFSVLAIVLVPYFVLRTGPLLWSVPNPTGLLLGEQWLAAETSSPVRTVYLIVSGVLTGALAVFSARRFAAARKGAKAG